MRDMLPKFAADRPIPLDGGIEVLVLEHHHVEPHGADEDGPVSSHQLRALTLLVNFVEDAATRSTFRTLQGAFATANVTARVFKGPGHVDDLRRFLKSFSVDSIDAVLFPGVDAVVSPDAVGRVVEALSTAAYGLLVLVGDDCRRWNALRGISGFVRGCPTTLPSTAASTLQLLAALSAPKTLTCLDHEDLAACLGSAQDPAVLVEAVWIGGTQKLAHASEADARAVSGASEISAHILGALLRLADVNAIMNAVRGNTQAMCNIHFAAPFDAIHAPSLHGRFAMVTMICKCPGTA
ncbi:MAG: hypothetical protein ABIQ60_06160 [Burkholderiaceae bacterium]